MKKNRHALFVALGILLAISGLLLIGTAYGYFTLPKLVEEINNAAIGAILTAFVTVMLLTQQSTSEEIKQRNSKVFEKKLEFVEKFLENLETIVADSQISDDEVNSLMFQLSRLRLHCHGEIVDKVLWLMVKMQEGMAIGDSDLRIDTVSARLEEVVTVLRSEIYYPKDDAAPDKGSLKGDAAPDKGSLKGDAAPDKGSLTEGELAGNTLSALLKKQAPPSLSEGPRYFILNTNKKDENNYHNRMLKDKRAIIWSEWKRKFEWIRTGDCIFLYQSGAGIVAAGESDGNLIVDAEAEQVSLGLVSFFRFDISPISPGKIKDITGRNMVFIQTLFSIDQKAGEDLWKWIEEHCPASTGAKKL